MSTVHNKHKHCHCNHQSNHAAKNETRMDVEFGSEFVGDAKRAAHAVETRVKSHAERYGFCQED